MPLATITFLSPLAVSRWIDRPPEGAVPFSEVATQVQQERVEAITAKGHALVVRLRGGRQLSSVLERDETISDALRRHGVSVEARRTVQERYETSLLHDRMPLFGGVPHVLAIGSWLFLVGAPRAISARREVVHQVLALVGIGLVTYCPVVQQFFYVFFGAVGIPYIHRPAAHALGFSMDLTAYLLTLAFTGWMFAIPAFALAIIGLSQWAYVRVNAVTLVISVLMLLWSAYSWFSGGGWFA